MERHLEKRESRLRLEVLVMIDYTRLWVILAEKGLKDRDLARLSGISVATVSRMRKGKPVSAVTLYQISRAVSCPMDDLLRVNNTL